MGLVYMGFESTPKDANDFSKVHFKTAMEDIFNFSITSKVLEPSRATFLQSLIAFWIPSTYITNIIPIITKKPYSTISVWPCNNNITRTMNFHQRLHHQHRY